MVSAMTRPSVAALGVWLLGGLATAGVGCKTVYVPNMVNAPLLAQKGEVRATLGSNNLQGAYAVTDGIGVIANGFWRSSTDGDSNATSGNEGEGHMLELGAGHFRSIGDLLLFETYAGLGQGKVRHDNWETINGARSDYRFSASAWKAFVQPSLGITRDYFDAAISSRFVVLKPYDTKAVNYPEARLRDDDLFGLDDHTFGFVEPAVTVRAGYKWVKLFVQYGFSLKLNQTPLKRDVNFLTAGIHVDFAPRFSL
jgi:hypothetical protein